MNVNLQQLVVALIMLVPGFIGTNIQKAFSARRYASDFEWVVKSLLVAIVLNGITLIFFIRLFGYDHITNPIGQVPSLANSIRIVDVFYYLGSLYLSSILYGFSLGLYPNLQLTAILNRLKLTNVGREESVWNTIFRKHRPEDRKATWLKIKESNELVIIGRLRHSSVNVDMDLPFEIYMNKVHYQSDDGRYVPYASDGMYLRLMPNQQAEILFKEEDWSPVTT